MDVRFAQTAKPPQLLRFYVKSYTLPSIIVPYLSITNAPQSLSYLVNIQNYKPAPGLLLLSNAIY